MWPKYCEQYAGPLSTLNMDTKSNVAHMDRISHTCTVWFHCNLDVNTDNNREKKKTDSVNAQHNTRTHTHSTRTKHARTHVCNLDLTN